MIYRTQIEQSVFDLVSGTLEQLGYNVVRIKNTTLGGVKTIQIMVEKVDSAQQITVADCEHISKRISLMLDLEDIVKNRYNLEVSSPGINRPLTRVRDFQNAVAKTVKCSLFQHIGEQKKFTGCLLEADEEKCIIELKETNEEGSKKLTIRYNEIEEACLQELQHFPKHPKVKNKSKLVKEKKK
ncbi:ribosome maturation factor RimP [Rickettsiales endosymbiont of Peranema trichophorum]|uniref:ribosome maturation factor RimP n=1 Tax=Rickettsiales endosymbiont of Peranema trichophorum TaxID=2486577 RepID=UPI0013EE703C|nr:ribosome maturation factor RimP [Rickettsiales endosymbiont of Peranema trichophorum]